MSADIFGELKGGLLLLLAHDSPAGILSVVKNAGFGPLTF
jgi:hypothetical protein